MAIAGTNIPLDSTEGMDKITTTEKVTTAYFSDGNTELLAANIISSSLSDTNENYYFGIAHSSTPATTEFNVTYGSTNGYGAEVQTGTKSETEAIYKQWANLLLAPTEVTGGFKISAAGSTGVHYTSKAKDSEIFVLSSRRTLMKDRLNKKNISIVLSGSNNAGITDAAFPKILHLTDDSANDAPTATPVGDRYNIVSGSDGTIQSPASTRTFGWFYPDVGTIVFSQVELSSSIPGKNANVGSTVVFDNNTMHGFQVATTTDANRKTPLRFINCLSNGGGKLKFRDEEDQVSAQYFCRLKAAHCNFSNNPTFVSGSLNELRQSTMRGNPTTFITGIQLYTSTGDLVAVGSLSTPLKKNFSSEATIKVKLTY